MRVRIKWPSEKTWFSSLHSSELQSHSNPQKGRLGWLTTASSSLLPLICCISVLELHVCLSVTEERECHEPQRSRKLLRTHLQEWWAAPVQMMEHLWRLPWDPEGSQRTQALVSERSLQSVMHVWHLESCHLAAYLWGQKWAHRIHKLLQKGKTFVLL